MSSAPKFRPLTFGVTRVIVREGAPGVRYVKAEQPADQGFFTEAMMAAIAQSAPEAKDRVRAFLDGRAAKVQKA